MKKFLISFLGALLLSGCMSADFTPWVGEQKDWPCATGGLATQQDGIDFWTTLPGKPYEVVGTVHVTRPNKGELAKVAREHGANAVVFGRAWTEYRGNILQTPATATTTSQGNLMATGYGSGILQGQYSGKSTTAIDPGSPGVPVYVQHAIFVLIRYKSGS
jgi:hypothetical protein